MTHFHSALKGLKADVYNFLNVVNLHSSTKITSKSEEFFLDFFIDAN